MGRLYKLPAYVYKARLGFLFGRRLLVLVHEGRRTGRRYTTPLECVEYDPATREVIIPAGWGERTSWVRNMRSGLAREVWIGRRRFVPTWRQLSVDEVAAVWDRYELRIRWIPRFVIRWLLRKILGWTYDGTPESRLRRAEQTPMFALRPRC